MFVGQSTDGSNVCVAEVYRFPATTVLGSAGQPLYQVRLLADAGPI